MARASGYFKTSYSKDLSLLETRLQMTSLTVFLAALLLFPFIASTFYVDIANQIFLAAIGAVSLMLLTGCAGQVSLGHAGLLAAGAFTTGVLFEEVAAPFWVTLPAAAMVGAVLGIVFGLPSLRLKGLYLAISTLALHFIVIFVGGEYESRRGYSTGILIDSPAIGDWELSSPRAWYFALFAIDICVVLFSLNLLRSRTGRAWAAIRDHDVVAEALGVPVHAYKLLAFVISSTLTAVAGCLFAYYTNFVTEGAFNLFLTIQYVAMVIIGGLGSILGALLGAAFVVLFPYVIESTLAFLPFADDVSGYLHAVNFSAFGLIMILFLVLEPDGLVGIWRRLRDYFLLWPFRSTPLGGGNR